MGESVHTIVKYHTVMKFALALVTALVAVSANTRTQDTPSTQLAKIFESKGVPRAKAIAVSEKITGIIENSGRSDMQKRQDIKKVLAQMPEAKAFLDKNQGTNKQSRKFYGKAGKGAAKVSKEVREEDREAKRRREKNVLDWFKRQFTGCRFGDIFGCW